MRPRAGRRPGSRRASCRIRRNRVAPSARLTASSRSRVLARASSRLATLTQAMRSTNPTAALSAISAGFTSRVTTSPRGRTVQPQAAGVRGRMTCDEARRESPSSACASVTDAPGARRPTSVNPLIQEPGADSRGIHTSTRSSAWFAAGRTRRKPGRMTPTTCTSKLLTVSRRPITSRIALQATLPQLVTDHDALDDDAVRILCGDEGSPERQRRGAEERQQIVCHPGRGDALHHTVDLEARVTALDLGDARDQPALRSHVEHSARLMSRRSAAPACRPRRRGCGQRRDKGASATARCAPR